MWVFLIAYHLVQGIYATDVKTWTANTNFENPRNWPNDQLPCANDRIIFPSDANIVSFLPSDLSFAEMILPMDGEFILREGSSLLVTGGKKEDLCLGSDIHFIVTIDYWFNPDNWNITSPRAYPKPDFSRKNQAVPHALAIPCSSDKVVFPKDNSFKTHLDDSQLTIGHIEINGIRYNNIEFQDLLSSRTGKLLFPGKPNVIVSGYGCNDDTGCKCSNDDPKVMEKVCAHVQPCPTVECSDPVKPIGHCCPLCGAYLEMEYGIDFQLGELIDFFKKSFIKPDFREIESFTFKTYKNNIQTVIVDSSRRKGAASEIAKIFQEKLSEDMEGHNTYKLRSVKVYSSTKWSASVPTQAARGGEGISTGGIVAIIFVMLCFIGGAVVWYIYKKRQIPGFNFARFDLRSNKVELELGTTPHEDLDPEGSSMFSFPSSTSEEKASIAKAFDNPIYDITIPGSHTNKTEGSLEKDEDIIENPMFMVFESSQEG